MQCSVIVVAWVLALVGGTAPAAEVGAWSRTAFDSAWTAAGDWEHAESVTLTLAPPGAGLEIVNRGSQAGWVAPVKPWEFDPGATLRMHVADLSHGQLTVQAEWIADDGRFLGAADVVDRVNESDVRVEVKLADFLPRADQPQPARMRVKLWLGGEAARAVVDELSVAAPRRWREAQTRTVAEATPSSPLEPDPGMTATPDGATLLAALEPGRPFAGLAIGERVAFDSAATVLLDVAWLPRGRASLQAVCFGGDGRYLASVDLFKDIDQAGPYEVSLSMYSSAFPAGTETIQFKLWLGGEGAAARIAGVWVGVVP